MSERHTSFLLVSATSVVILLSTIATGQVLRSISGNVTDVYDGNNITVTDSDRTEWRVKFAAIDAPELGQPFGKKARKEVLELLLDRPVKVTFDRTEGGDRVVGIVELESQREVLRAVFPININQYLVGQGIAWYDRSFRNDQSQETRDLYSKLEADARQGKKGLWAEKNPTPPWEYRGRPVNSNLQPARAAEDGSSPVIVANKTSRLYYLSYCPDYDKVPVREQVSFKTPSDAQAAGFKLAKNCELK